MLQARADLAVAEATLLTNPDVGVVEADREAIDQELRQARADYLPSIDLRITVIGGPAVAAMMRVPANVVGDGSSTIKELITRKNAFRRSNVFHRFVPIRITQATVDQLAEVRLRLNSVPEPGRRVFLHYKANLSSGGDSINITDRIHTGFLRLAERAMKCFGSVSHAGVDILAERLDLPPEDQPCIICEINCNNDLPIHVFPLFGRSIDVATKEIMTYFPDASPAGRRRWHIAVGRNRGLIAADERARRRLHVLALDDLPGVPASRQGQFDLDNFVFGNIDFCNVRRSVRNEILESGADVVKRRIAFRQIAGGDNASNRDRLALLGGVQRHGLGP